MSLIIRFFICCTLCMFQSALPFESMRRCYATLSGYTSLVYSHYKKIPLYQKIVALTAVGGAAAFSYALKIAYDRKIARNLPVEWYMYQFHGRGLVKDKWVVNDPESITIYAHGFGSGLLENLPEKYYAYYPGDTVTFKFRDAQDENDCIDVRYSNLAQGGDIEVLLKVLLEVILKYPDKKKFVLHGFSRGGGTILNALSVIDRIAQGELIEPFNKILTQSNAQKLGSLIRAGGVVLECPYTALSVIIRQPFENLKNCINNYLENMSDSVVAVWHKFTSFSLVQGSVASSVRSMELTGFAAANIAVLPQRYATFYQEPLKSAADISGYKMFVYFEQNDNVVTNCNDIALVNALKSKNNEVYAVKIDGGGHTGDRIFFNFALKKNQAIYVWLLNYFKKNIIKTAYVDALAKTQWDTHLNNHKVC